MFLRITIHVVVIYISIRASCHIMYVHTDIWACTDIYDILMFEILTVFVCIITICKCRNTNIINHFYFYIRESVQAIIVFVSIMICTSLYYYIWSLLYYFFKMYLYISLQYYWFMNFNLPFWLVYWNRLRYWH